MSGSEALPAVQPGDIEARSEQITWQRQAAGALAVVLEHAYAAALPPIAWTVQPVGMVLLGRALANPMTQRRDDWNAWRAAIASLAGQDADNSTEHTDRDGTTRLVSQWEHALRLAGKGSRGTVVLVADLFAED